MTGIQTPVALSSIPKFEIRNPTISINVLVYEKKDLIPVYTSKFCNQRPNHINLLLLSKGDKFHYTLITSLSRLVGDRKQHVGKTFVCQYCLHIHSHTNTVSRITFPNVVGIPPNTSSIPRKATLFWNSTKFRRLTVLFVLYAHWIFHKTRRRTRTRRILLSARLKKIFRTLPQNLYLFWRQGSTGIL